MKSRIWTFYGLILTLIMGSCSSGDNNSFNPEINPNIPDPIESQCPHRLLPQANIEPIVTIGDGSSDSCDEVALRSAATQVNEAGSGTLLFDCGSQHTITLTKPLILGSSAQGTILIDGEGQITLSGQNQTRIIDLEHHSNFIIQRISLNDGFVPEDSDEEEPYNSGAAIRHPWFGTFQAIDVHFSNNHCESQQAEIGGGAIYAGGLTVAILSGCVFANNSASNGGGILNRGSTLTIIDTVFFSNEATGRGEAGQYGNGGGVYIDGMNYDTPGDFIACGVLFEKNMANTHGSGMFAFFYEGSNAFIDQAYFVENSFGMEERGSGALYHQTVPLQMTNTTFALNSGEHAGGFFLASDSYARIENCTFSGNSAVMNGGAIFNGASEADVVGSTFIDNFADWGPAIFTGESAIMRLKNTLFAYNTTVEPYAPLACTSSLIDAGGNMQWPEIKPSGSDDRPCVEGITFADPLLISLDDNGGFAPTAALSEGSPAIDFTSDCSSQDQRGMDRVGSCDCGAYEFQ